MAYNLEEIAGVVAVLNKVAERKRQAADYGSMASTIANELGRYDGGSIHEYQEEGLNICEEHCNDRDGDYRGKTISIRTTPRGTIRGNVFYSSFGEITTYLPGKWEKRFKELYEPLKPKAGPNEQEIEVPAMTKREIEDLKERFGIE